MQYLFLQFHFNCLLAMDYQYITDNVVWSGAAFTANRTMTNQHFTSTVQFIESLPPTGDDTASNVPSFTEEFSGDPLGVYC